MADTLPSETVVVDAPKNDATPPAVTPPELKPADNSEVERLRKEAEQATMRANQLANQLKAKEDAEAAEKAKQMEENNEFKTLYEQEKTKRQEIENAQVLAEKVAALKTESDKLFAGFPDQVKALADESGMSLTDTDEDSIEAFKKKLEKVNGLVAQPKVTANNPGNPSGQATLTPQQLHETLNDPAKFEAYVKQNFKGISSLTRKS
jgi:hypothetical protein